MINPTFIPITIEHLNYLSKIIWIRILKHVLNRVGNFRQKNNSAEDGIDGTNGYFRRSSGCSAEQKISEFRSKPFRRREKNSEFRSVEQKIEAISRSFLPNTPAEEITAWNSVPWNKYRSKLSKFRSEPFRGKETTQNKTRQPKISKIVRKEDFWSIDKSVL
jgi:hypothetical protein